MIKDVLEQIDNFYFLVDFIIIDTTLVNNMSHQISLIIECPILATTNEVINCRNRVVKLSLNNMTLELNVFNVCKLPSIDTKEV